MSTESNKGVFRRLIDEAINQGLWATVDEVLAPDVVEHESFGPDIPANREGVKMILGMFRQAFPDLEVTIEDLIAEGDRVAARTTWRGTHQGELMGIPPTGKPVAFASTDIVRMAGGQVAEHWAVTDNMALMQQLGVIDGQG